MTSAIQIRRDTAAQIATKTPLEGELAYATDTKRLSVGDGLTAGGTPLAKESEAGIAATVAASAKTTPVDADLVGIADSADSNALKKLTFANLATWFGSKLGAVTDALTGKTTPVDADTMAISDSAASSATKKLTWANLKATLKTYNDTLYQPLATALTNFGTLVGTIVSGDIIYGSGAATLARLAKGSDGQVLTLASGVPSWATASSAATVKRNRYTNPAFQLSSVNGNTAGTANGYVPADDCAVYRVTSAGTITTQRVQSTTPNGSKDRVRITITAADASLAAGEYLSFLKNTVGQEVADFRYGTASAKQGIVRFGFKGPQGTYAFRRTNSALNRSFVSLFTISAPNANVDTEQTIVVTGDTSGTWLTDSGVGFTDEIVLACGSTFQGTTGWQAGNIMGTSGVSNGMGTISSVFEIFDIGNYADFTSTGAAPTWEMPSFSDDLFDAAWKLRAAITFNGSTGAVTASYNCTVTKNSTGDYTLGFVEPMPHANYAVVGVPNSVGAANVQGVFNIAAAAQTGLPTIKTTTACRVVTGYGSNGAAQDFGTVCVSIFG